MTSLTDPVSRVVVVSICDHNGFIAPICWNFCGSCNRPLLASDRKIRTGLFTETEIGVKILLCIGATKRGLVALSRDVVETGHAVIILDGL